MRGGTAGRLGGCLAIVVVVGLATGALTAASAASGATVHPVATAQPGTAVVRGAWGNGQLVPGIAALNAGGDAAVTAISCAAPGYCTAGGYYTSAANGPESSSARKAFVVSEAKGRWGTARQLPGTSSGGWTSVTAISCTSPGNCVAGGYDGTTVSSVHYSQGFVASEVNGTWGTARHLSSRKPNEATTVTSVSCSKAGDCLAGGYTRYTEVLGDDQTYYYGYEFVVEQRNGSWGALRALAGESLNYSTPATVSCVSPGNCAAGIGASQVPVIAQEKSGTWRSTTLPGFPAPIDASQGPTVVACAKAGACTAGGTFYNYLIAGSFKVWVASESGYTWGRGSELAGLQLGGVFVITVNAISCAAPGYCTLAGQIWSSTTKTSTAHGFTATQVGGHWSSARVVVSGANGDVPSVSCPALGYCLAAVDNTGYAPHVIEETGGIWGEPLVLPGLTSPGLVNAVSCAKPGWCAAGGSYSVQGQNQAIVANETVPAGPAGYGGVQVSAEREELGPLTVMPKVVEPPGLSAPL
jgi:hypothetical protein